MFYFFPQGPTELDETKGGMEECKTDIDPNYFCRAPTTLHEEEAGEEQTQS